MNRFAWGSILGVIALGGVLAMHQRAQRARAFPPGCARKGPIEIVPLGGTQAGVWAAEFAQRYRTEITIAAPVPLPESALDAPRGQYVAEKLVAATSQRRAPGDHRLIVLVMDENMYIAARPDWQWAYAYSDPDERTTVISLWHMGMEPGAGGGAPPRFTKMLARHLGREYCGLKRTGPPQSVMRQQEILGPDDLDAIDETNWSVEAVR